MSNYKHLSLSERFEEIIENIKAYGSKTNPDNYENFYNLFQETMKELNLTQSQLIGLATDRKTRVDFTLAFMNIANLISQTGNHLLDNEQMAQKTAQNIAVFATELNNHLSETDTKHQKKETNMQDFLKKAVEKWYMNEYDDNNTNSVSYHTDLDRVENIHSCKLESPFGSIYCATFSPSTKGAKSLTFLRLENEDVMITKDNIHLYYEFMSDEEKHTNLQVVMDALDDRAAQIEEDLGVWLVGGAKEFVYSKEKPIGQAIFGVPDTLKPIDEYIAQIEQSQLYKKYIKVQVTSENKHNYMMLSRLQSDCEYFIGHGNGSTKHLYYDTVEEHIDEMKKLWNGFDTNEKPEWLTMQEIEEYKAEMLTVNPERSFSEIDEYLTARQAKKASLLDIQTDPELETPEGLEQAKDELKEKVNQATSLNQDYK